MVEYMPRTTIPERYRDYDVLDVRSTCFQDTSGEILTGAALYFRNETITFVCESKDTTAWAKEHVDKIVPILDADLPDVLGMDVEDYLLPVIEWRIKNG